MAKMVEFCACLPLQGPPPPNSQTHARTHAHTPTHTHTHTHSLTHSLTHTPHTHTHARARACTHLHAFIKSQLKAKKWSLEGGKPAGISFAVWFFFLLGVGFHRKTKKKKENKPCSVNYTFFLFSFLFDVNRCKSTVNRVMGLYVEFSFNYKLLKRERGWWWIEWEGHQPRRNQTGAVSTTLGWRFRVQELSESRGGRPGLSVPVSLTVSVDVKQHWAVLRRWSQFVLNMSTDIRGHEALPHQGSWIG